MPYSYKKISLTLIEPVRLILEKMSKQNKISALHQLRSRMLLYLALNTNAQSISKTYGISYKSLLRLKSRWAIYEPQLALIWESKMSLEDKNNALYKKIEELLSDNARSGCPATISAEQYCQIMALALCPPKGYNRPITHWTRRELAEECILQGIVPTISTSQIGRFLKRNRP